MFLSCWVRGIFEGHATKLCIAWCYVGSRSKVTAEVPNVSMEDVKAIMGEALCQKAKNTPKQLQVQ